MHHNREAYRAFAAAMPDLPLYAQPWFLDAVCAGGEWGAALAVKNGRPVAALPYFVKKRLGWEYVTMPPLCKHLGPFLLPEYRALDWEMKLYRELEGNLPKLAAFEQNFHTSVSNWLPFYWKGYRQTTYYTYTLALQPTEEALFQGIAKNYRNKIRAAAGKVRVRHDLPLAQLGQLVAETYQRQGLAPSLSLAEMERVWSALQSNGQGQLFFAEDLETEAVHEAMLLAWDTRSAYLLLSGANPASRAMGAGVFLQWQLILYAKNTLRLPVFDFEGSVMPNIEAGRRDFGAQQQPYFRVRKEWSALWRWGKLLREMRR